MNRKLTLLSAVCLFFIFKQASASYITGGVILYKNIGGLKFEITYKMYRDCRGSSMDSLYTKMSAGKLSKNLSVKRVSIKDITTTCKKLNNPCSSPNTSGAGFGIEEHIFKDTVDFNSATDSVFKQYCWITFSASWCCRSNYITTGGNNSSFILNTSFNICEAPQNTSPQMLGLPLYYLCCNQPVLMSDNAYDEDNDSLSYSLAPAYTGDTSKIKWKAGFSYLKPFTVYWPAGYDKSKGPKPDANPPIGMYLDPETGELIFTPTDCSESTPLTVKISEWRKDKTGKYKLIGEVNREVTYNTMACNNNIPTLNGPYKYDVCENDKICFVIKSDDRSFTPPPPGKTIIDTLTMTWSNPIKGSTITIVDTTARLKSAKFCWTPATGSERDLPYLFSVLVNDNACNYPGLASKSYSIRVKKRIKATHTIKQIRKDTYVVKAVPDSSVKGYFSYGWEIVDSAQTYSGGNYFKSSYTPYSKKQEDTLVFSKGGKFYIILTINNPPYNCSTTYFDTLKVSTSIPFLQISPFYPYDTTVCRNITDTIFPILHNAAPPVKYSWNTSPADTLPYLAVDIKNEATYTVDVFTGDSSHRRATWIYNLFPDNITVSAGIDRNSCVSDTVTFKANAKYYTDTVFWKWFFDGQLISDKQSIKVTKPGKYIIAVNDRNNCKTAYDTVEMKNMQVSVFAGNDEYKCPRDTFGFAASGLDTSNKKTGKYTWYYDNTSGTILSTQSNVKYSSLNDGKLIVKLQQTQGTLSCLAFDTVNFYYYKNPEVLLKDTAVCQNKEQINIMQLIKKPIYTQKGKISWYSSTNLKKPDGNALKTTDLIFDADTSELNNYYLKFGKSLINLGIISSDIINLKFSYIDTFGCKSKMSDSVKFTIKNIYDISFLNSEIKKCYGDSIKKLSDEAGVNIYGGQWVTNNDSAGYEKWAIGNKQSMPEKIKTKNLNKNGGKYLLQYILDYNNCKSEKDIVLNVIPIPVISWDQSTTEDSVIFEDKSSYAGNRFWFVGGKLYSKEKLLTLSKTAAKEKKIMIKAYNELCEADSFIKTQITWKTSNLAKQNGFEIYPNPAENILYIQSVNNKPFGFTIFNEFSQKVIHKSNANSKEAVDLSKVSQGIYLVLIQSDEKYYSLRFFKK